MAIRCLVVFQQYTYGTFKYTVKYNDDSEKSMTNFILFTQLLFQHFNLHVLYIKWVSRYIKDISFDGFTQTLFTMLIYSRMCNNAWDNKIYSSIAKTHSLLIIDSNENGPYSKIFTYCANYFTIWALVSEQLLNVEHPSVQKVIVYKLITLNLVYPKKGIFT